MLLGFYCVLVLTDFNRHLNKKLFGVSLKQHLRIIIALTLIFEILLIFTNTLVTGVESNPATGFEHTYGGLFPAANAFFGYVGVLNITVMFRGFRATSDLLSKLRLKHNLIGFLIMLVGGIPLPLSYRLWVFQAIPLLSYRLPLPHLFFTTRFCVFRLSKLKSSTKISSKKSRNGPSSCKGLKLILFTRKRWLHLDIWLPGLPMKSIHRLARFPAITMFLASVLRNSRLFSAIRSSGVYKKIRLFLKSCQALKVSRKLTGQLAIELLHW